MESKNIIGKQIRALRIEQGLTQAQLAARCNVLGYDLSRGALAKVEAGCIRITDINIRYFAQALKVTEGDLFK
ncbi:helix-turn-helix domain-containing protein [Aliivibrio fischeri]|uniref:Helix-turn-helix domain-containing protein n=1 Tax=Aliivibrio fischeri TaxID=668 RepID=A0A6N3Z9C4_ALIFS|nr:helix-turn-helix transcriptional regulator [Aliivibrio fischeri]MUK46403.1 helix-turn-helix domain-containing protein [Aliivibrio fischeri]MUK81884.1 helix-turn-helix domain-containing protein [Aliivibrio fischeri]MUK85062.1 helix-turn-helix domain-containing protein [Aliivibrio fischeri]